MQPAAADEQPPFRAVAASNKCQACTAMWSRFIPPGAAEDASHPSKHSNWHWSGGTLTEETRAHNQVATKSSKKKKSTSRGSVGKTRQLPTVARPDPSVRQSSEGSDEQNVSDGARRMDSRRKDGTLKSKTRAGRYAVQHGEPAGPPLGAATQENHDRPRRTSSKSGLRSCRREPLPMSSSRWPMT